MTTERARPVIAVTGGKGGCGKTTTTLGLALSVAAAGGRALAVDADREMPDLAALAGVETEPTLSRAAEALAAATRPLGDAGRAAVVPAGPGDDRSDLRETLGAVRRAPGVGLVDCPAGAGPDAVAPLRPADGAVVVATPTPAGLRDAAKSAALCRTAGTPVAVAALTRSRSVPDGVGRLLDAPVVAVPPVDDPPRASPARSAYRRIVDRLGLAPSVPVQETTARW